jgi:hypothetical protein
LQEKGETMKKSQNIKSILTCMFITGLLTFTLSFNGSAQDSAKSVSKKGVVVLKIKKDNNGKTTIIDTTFTITTPFDHKELEEYLKKHEEELGKLGKELENIEVLVDVPDFPDSLATDSEMKQFKLMGKNIRSPHFRWQDKPEGYDYEFDVPCMPDVEFPCFKWDEDFKGDFRPGHDMKVLRYNNKSQSLSDIIGDIPMDRVKSYSIKERKNGKRIIIDIEDAPLFEKQDRVIIMREPGK